MANITYAFDPAQAASAGRRFAEREGVAKDNVAAYEEGRLTLVETKERLAKRVNRILAHVEQANPDGDAAGLPPSLRDMVGRAVTPADMSDALVERVIGGAADFLFIEFLEQGQGAARAVGRIFTRLASGDASYGTGFMVSPDLLLTNHHVLPDANAAAASRVEMDYARDGARQTRTVQPYRLQPERFFLTNPELDMSLVAVAPVSEPVEGSGVRLETFGWLPLIPDEGKIVIGESVNVVQHPLGQIKQVAIRDSQLIDMPGQNFSATLFAYYKADTEPGSSGSPVFNDQWEVIALHHSAAPRVNADGKIVNKSGQVWRQGVEPPSTIDWIANEGVRISRLSAWLQTQSPELDPAKRALLDGALRPQTVGPSTRPAVESKPNAADVLPAIEVKAQPPSDPAKSAPTYPPVDTTGLQGFSPAQTPSPPGPDDAAELIVRIRFEGLLAKAVQVVVDHPSAELAERQEARVARPQMGDGFDPAFLGFPAPLPTLDFGLSAYVLEDGGSVLTYPHYSVIYNADRRIAYVSAVNLDSQAPCKVKREGPDVWRFDPRLPKALQVGEELYRNDPLDKGHLTRRQDAAWGATETEAKAGNDGTFHWTNCSPQHEVFNQSAKASTQGLLLWGGLENHVTAQVQADRGRASIYNGPVLRPDDRELRGVKLPKQFWKVIAVKAADGSPRAYGFVLSQEGLIRGLATEAFDPGPYAPWQLSLRTLGGLTGLDFGPLVGADPLSQSDPARESLRPSIKPLETLSDIVL